MSFASLPIITGGSTMDFSQRHVTSVNLHELGERTDGDGSTYIYGQVELDLSGSAIGYTGPSVVIAFAMPATPGKTIEEAERALLASALDVLNRGWQETPDDLFRMLREARSIHVV